MELARVAQRHAGSEGERQMVHAVKARLPVAVRGRIEGFVAWTSPNTVLGLHAAGLLAAGLLGLGKPLVGAALCAAFTASLWAEGTGAFSLFRRVAPKQASYNLVVPHVGHAGPPQGAGGTVVIAAPLDSPRWRPDRPRWMRRPMKAVVTAAVVMTSLLFLNALAEPWGRPTQGMYLTSLLVLVATIALVFVMQRRTSGVDEDPSGPTVLLELTRRFAVDPPAHVDLWAVFTGCGHAYQNGMAAFLAMHGPNLPQPVFVLALDDPGRSPVGGVVSEGPLVRQHHRPTGPALVERMRWAGVQIPAIDKAGVTDARAALLAGYRALALSGAGDGPSDAAGATRAADLAERVVRWFDEDVARVAGDATKLQLFAVPAAPVERSPGALDAEPAVRPAGPLEVPSVVEADSVGRSS